MSLTQDPILLTSSLPAGQITPSPAAGFLSALPLQPALDLLPVTQRQQQYSNQPLIIGQSLVNVAGSKSFNFKIVPSSERRKTPASITKREAREPTDNKYRQLLGLLQQYALATSVFLVSFPCEEITDTN